MGLHAIARQAKTDAPVGDAVSPAKKRRVGSRNDANDEDGGVIPNLEPGAGENMQLNVGEQLSDVHIGLEELGRALDTHMANLPADRLKAMQSVVYCVLHAAHSYICLDLSDHGSSEEEDGPSFQRLRNAIQDGTTGTYLSTLFRDAAIDFDDTAEDASDV